VVNDGMKLTTLKCYSAQAEQQLWTNFSSAFVNTKSGALSLQICSIVVFYYCKIDQFIEPAFTDGIDHILFISSPN